ncbi:DUF6879 family protein [Actinocorallia sp. A-T 12471]|uniref:DUF6879 family protein n=1 Tax=Actinocorallia sp. A-T 12471 TaxID=3089813 RepID=UPI0029D0CF0A|nr:DUF6879 family protein [Actinocorallia sp. A-T 12471]MDX6738944.1 hypothetical protein [Actinocorallia sp. A-T 12471]
MESISASERQEMISRITHEALHLELRDRYAMDAEVIARWQAGERDEVFASVKPWCDEVRAGVAAGKTYRRASVVSEPLSVYQRFCVAANAVKVEAGEDIRVVPRRLLSAIGVPGNDFWLLDRRVVVFGIFSGDDERVDIQWTEEHAVVGFCLRAFESIWALGIPQPEYELI